MTTILTDVAVADFSAFANINEAVELTNIGTLFALLEIFQGDVTMNHRTSFHRSRFQAALLILAACGLATACAQPPAEKLAAAEAAVAAAEKAGAADYASVELEAAKDSLSKARAEISAQAKSSAVSRSYDGAAEWLDQAVARADAARSAVAPAKELLRKDAEATLELAAKQLERAAILVAKLDGCRRPPKDPEADPALLRARIDELETDADSAVADLESGALKEALRKADAANDEAVKTVEVLEKVTSGC